MSRLARLCSWCSAPLPKSLQPSPAEVRRIETEEAASKQRLETLAQARAADKALKSALSGADAAVRALM